MDPPAAGKPVLASTNGIRGSGYQPGGRGWLEPPQFGLEEVTLTYCSRKRARLLFKIVWPLELVRSETETFTLLSPPLGAFTIIWNDSYSPFPAYSWACVPLPAASDGPTRCKLGATQMIGLWALAIPADRSKTANVCKTKLEWKKVFVTIPSIVGSFRFGPNSSEPVTRKSSGKTSTLEAFSCPATGSVHCRVRLSWLYFGRERDFLDSSAECER